MWKRGSGSILCAGDVAQARMARGPVGTAWCNASPTGWLEGLPERCSRSASRSASSSMPTESLIRPGVTPIARRRSRCLHGHRADPRPSTPGTRLALLARGLMLPRVRGSVPRVEALVHGPADIANHWQAMPSHAWRSRCNISRVTSSRTIRQPDPELLRLGDPLDSRRPRRRPKSDQRELRSKTCPGGIANARWWIPTATC